MVELISGVMLGRASERLARSTRGRSAADTAWALAYAPQIWQSGVAKATVLKVTTSGTGGVGSFTASCTGAVGVAGAAQAKTVSASYTVDYGFAGFTAPRPGAAVPTSGHKITVRFRLDNAAGQAIGNRWLPRSAPPRTRKRSTSSKAGRGSQVIPRPPGGFAGTALLRDALIQPAQILL